MNVTHLYCSACGKEYAPGKLYNLCECGKPLMVAYDLERAALTLTRESLATLVHVSLREDRLRLLHAGRWQNLSDGSASPERIRSAIAAGIYLRGVRS